MALSFGQACDIGCLRKRNEDAVFAKLLDTNTGVFAAIDGMGGEAGIEAASIVVNRLEAACQDHSIEDPLNFLTAVFTDANRAIIDAGQNGGATVSAAVIQEEKAAIAHMGNTIAYQLTPQAIHRQTNIHDAVQAWVDAGFYPNRAEAEEKSDVPNRVYNVLGHAEEIWKIETKILDFIPGMALLLCTDGLEVHLTPDQIQRLCHASTQPQSACDALVAAANDDGGVDNIGLVLISNDFVFAEASNK